MVSDLRQRRLYFGWILLAATLAAYVLITFLHFPYFGLFFLLWAFYIVASSGLKAVTGWQKIYGFLTVSLALGLLYRSDFTLVFINILATIWFGSLYFLGETKFTSGMDLLLAPLTALSKIFFQQPVVRLTELQESTKGRALPLAHWFQSALITGALLTVIVPLLMSANPLFNNLIFSWFSLDFIDAEWAITWGMRISVFLVLMWFLPRLAGPLKQEKNKPTVNDSNSSLFVPKVVLLTVIGLFIVTQIQLYSLSPEQMTAQAITHSQRTKEVFSQLSVVALIIFGVLAHKTQKVRRRLIDYGLLLEALVITGFGLQSDVAYIVMHGFTQKRLWGLAIILLILGVYAILAWSWRYLSPDQKLWPRVSVFAGVWLLLVNVAHFNVLVMHVNQPRVNGKVDLAYLARLPSDSYGWREQIIRLEQACLVEQCDVETHSRFFNLLYQADFLKRSYEQWDIRSFHIANLLTYQQIKTMDIETLIQSLQTNSPTN